MSAVEDRIVGMKFENRQFEAGAKSSIGILGRLKQALNLQGAGKGLSDIQSTASRFSLAGLTNATAGVSGKFLAMSTIAITAIAGITTKAIDAGIRIGKAFTIEPLKAGFQEYETNLNAVQTILSNTQAAGTKLKDVNAALSELNTYSDKTIYNFSEMARNIGTFTAAGVDLKTATSSIKGIANLAAVSGSNSQQASTAMYQLSQAISAGRVSLEDWNSVVNAGMGGTVFQRALAQNAEKLGTLSKGAVELKGKMKNVTIAGQSFRESITAKPGEKSWLTSEVLTQTLAQFTGDLSDADLAAQGFNASQIKAIQAQAKTAQAAATEVKTFSQLIGTLQEAAGSGWSNSFQILFGDFEEAKKLFTSLNNVLGGYVSKSANARNALLKGWKELGGRTALLKSFENIFKAIVAIVTPISKAFRDIFPATTAKQLYAITLAFLEFTKHLKIGAETSDLVRRTFRGVFAILSIGVSIVKAVFGVIGKLFGLMANGSGGFLEVTAQIGDFLVKLDQTIKRTDFFTKLFEKVGQVLLVPIGLIKILGQVLGDAFSGFRANGLAGLEDSLGRITDRLKPLSALGGKVAAVWAKLGDIFQAVGRFLAPVGKAIGDALHGIGDAMAKAFKAGDFNSVYDALNTGLLAGILLVVKKFVDKGLNIDFGGGLVSGIKETFGALTDTLSAMQAQVQSKTLITIAGAVALLTASIVALSLIDSAALTKSLTALGVAFGQLLLAMSILTKIAGSAGIVKVPAIAAAMVLLAGAVLILSAAVRNLSGLSWGELIKGLTGVAGILVIISGFAATLGKSSGAMLRVGLAMVPLALGIKIMASAIKDLGNLSVGEIVKGLLTLGGALGIIAIAMKLMPALPLQAAGLVILSGALLLMGKALKVMGGMTWQEIAKAMVTLAGSLAILAGALYLMTAALPGAAALIVAAGALVILAPALVLMGKMTWGEIARGMVTLAGALAIIAGGLALMTAALPGAAALIVAAGALAILAPVLVTLGAMSWGMIVKGLVAIAGAFVVIGGVSAILAPLTPAILAFAAALLVLGAAFTLIGVGALALATAFSIFAAAGAAGIATVGGLINLIPQFLKKFAEGIIGFATTIASQADKFVKAFTSLVGSLLDAVIKLAPKIGEAFNKLLTTALDIITKNIPLIAAAGVKLTVGFLTAIKNNIGPIVKIAGDIIVRFLDGISSQIPRIVKSGTDLIIKFMQAISDAQGRLLDAGAKMIVKFVNNLATTIRSNSGDLRTAGGRVASAIISGLTGGLSDGIGKVADAAIRVARSALNAAKNFLGIFSPSREFKALGEYSSEGLGDGLINKEGYVEKSAERVSNTALEAVRKSMENMVNVGSDFNPVVTPVLDLDQLTKDASRIGSLMGENKIAADLTNRQASSIYAEGINNETSNMEGSGDTFIEFKQYNTSPKALSAGEIYANTNSQFARAKEALTK